MRNKKKVTYDQAVNYIKFRLDSRQKEFDETAKQFTFIMANGAGINNIHMLDTIRRLNWLYTDIAALLDAKRALNVEF